MQWFQNYDPLGNAVLSTLMAALPIVVLLGSIALFQIRIHFSALIGLAVALGIAVFVYGMPVRVAGATHHLWRGLRFVSHWLDHT